MTKAEIVAEIASKTGIEKGAVQTVVENFMEVVKASMARVLWMPRHSLGPCGYDVCDPEFHAQQRGTGSVLACELLPVSTGLVS